MGIMNVLSGKNWRNNKIQALTLAQPLERVEAAQKLQGLMKAYAFALSWTVDFAVKQIAGEDSIVKPYAQVGRKVNEVALIRLSSYLAHRIQALFLNDTPSFYKNSDGTEDETSKAILRDVAWVLNTMYPSTDAIVAEALSRHVALEKDVAMANSLRQAKEAEIYDDLLGVPHAELTDAIRRTIAIATTLGSARGMVAETLNVGLRK